VDVDAQGFALKKQQFLPVACTHKAVHGGNELNFAEIS
jgi:hypothetical protein